MFYICNRCGSAFDENDAVYETFRHNEVVPGGDELFMTCPDCGNSDYESATLCCRCGEPLRNGDLIGGYYCEKCLNDMTTADLEHQFCLEQRDCFAEFLHEKEREQ